MDVTKEFLRSELIQKRNSLSIHDRIQGSQTIISQFQKGEYFHSISILHCYCSYGSEVITSELLQTVVSNQTAVVVPVVKNSKGELIHSTISSDTIFEEGVYGIPQPKLISEVPTEKLNDEHVLIIVPIVGFDIHCNRLGYGGGYYDRFLQQVPKAQKIGIAFSLQETSSIPIEPTDIPLDEIITESKVYKRSREL